MLDDEPSAISLLLIGLTPHRSKEDRVGFSCVHVVQTQSILNASLTRGIHEATVEAPVSDTSLTGNYSVISRPNSEAVMDVNSAIVHTSPTPYPAAGTTHLSP